MIRTKEQRQAERDWCEQYNWQQSDMDEIEGFGHALVLTVSIGAFVWIVAAALAGWLTP